MAPVVFPPLLQKEQYRPPQEPLQGQTVYSLDFPAKQPEALVMRRPKSTMQRAGGAAAKISSTTTARESYQGRRGGPQLRFGELPAIVGKGVLHNRLFWPKTFAPVLEKMYNSLHSVANHKHLAFSLANCNKQTIPIGLCYYYVTFLIKHSPPPVAQAPCSTLTRRRRCARPHRESSSRKLEPNLSSSELCSATSRLKVREAKCRQPRPLQQNCNFLQDRPQLNQNRKKMTYKFQLIDRNIIHFSCGT